MDEGALRKISKRVREAEPQPGDPNADLILIYIPMLVKEVRRLKGILDEQ